MHTTQLDEAYAALDELRSSVAVVDEAVHGGEHAVVADVCVVNDDDVCVAEDAAEDDDDECVRVFDGDEVTPDVTQQLTLAVPRLIIPVPVVASGRSRAFLFC